MFNLPLASSPPTRLRGSLLLALVCVIAAGTVVLAQGGTTYDLHWNVVSGGGSLSTGTNYRINYSFGQPSTIALSSGTNWQVGQGYWYGGIWPTAIKLVSFTATPAGPGLLLAWETASEHDNLGFYLYRQAGPNGPSVRLNEVLIPSRSPGGDQGASYTFYDATAPDGVACVYTLEDVDVNGTPTPHGPVEAIAPYVVFLPLVQR